MGKREQFGQKFIYFILVLWFGTEVILSSTIEKIYIWKTSDLNDIMAYIVLVLLVIQIVFFQKYQLNELVFIALVSMPIIIATIHSGHNKMISTWIFIVAVKYIDFERVVKISYYIELAMTILIIYLFASGVISEITTYRGAVLRHSLGFSHPNQLGIRVFLLVVSRCYLRRRRFNLLDWGLIILAAIFVNRVANSKTSCYALIILSVIMLIHIAISKRGFGEDKFSDFMIIVAVMANLASVVLSFIQVKAYPLLSRFDVLMSKRFSQCHRTLQYYGVKIFGQDVQLMVNRPILGKFYHFWLDNAYMSLILRYGPIVFILFSALYIWTMIMLKNMGQYALVEILCLYAVYGMMENNFFSMSQNLFLLLLSYPVYRRMDYRDEKRNLLSRVRFTW